MKKILKRCVMTALLLTATRAAEAIPAGGQTAPTTSANPIANPLETPPRDWLAFLAYQGGYTSPQFFALGKTPVVMLFQDGRVFWRDDQLKYDAPNHDREMWRQSKLAPQALKDFIAQAQAIQFLTAQPSPPPAPVTNENGTVSLSTMVISDAATTLVGLHLGKAQRVISEYALGAYGDRDKNDPYIQAALKMEKMLSALRPQDDKARALSQRFEPLAIRIQFLPVFRIELNRQNAIWPLAEKPDMEGALLGKDYFYAGADAQKILAALDANSTIQIGDKAFNAVWTPAIAVPKPDVKPQEKPVIAQ